MTIATPTFTDHDPWAADTAYPTAQVVAVRANPTFRGSWLVTVQCPHCHGRHTHDAATTGELLDGLGHRVGDCPRPIDSPAGYLVGPAYPSL